MSIYHVWVCLEMEDEVEANSPEEAFEILSTDAMAGGTWDYKCDVLEEGDDET